jgi:hypothetical protein
MKHRNCGRLVLISLACIAISVTLALVVRASLGRAQAVSVVDVTATIKIGSQVGETFAAPPANAAPRLTAQQAYAKYIRHNDSSETTIPSNMTVRLGFLTLPVGPADKYTRNLVTKDGIAYAVLDQLAYGYSWHSCPVYMTLHHMSHPKTPCIEWTFINANTGQQVVTTWQT